jgi:hypothetical protein
VVRTAQLRSWRINVTVRPIAALTLALLVAGCGGAAPTTPQAPGATSPAATTTTASAAAAIDLSGLDACALVPEATVAALTGETGFRTDKTADAGSSTCFWGVVGAPQYLEVRIDRRTASLGDYSLNVNGAACPGTTIPGIGTEARGGVCVGAQTKVWLIAMDRGVSVQVIVNEPKGPLTPAGLVEAVKGVLAGIG